mmetsp:Transcript_5296/g.11737  ORF Transcript_5296/g.11737 Transcript_5296/m.11737 type:complete len:261 (+) Transcript_5296:489-1271(+)
MEEHAVLNNRISSQCFPGSKVRNTKHSHTSMTNFDISQSLPSLEIISSRRIQVKRIPVVISRNTKFPNGTHILLMDLPHGRTDIRTKRGLELKETSSSQKPSNRKERQRINPIQYTGSTSILQHPIRSEQFTHGPSDNGEHGETGVTDFGFLHGVQVEGFGEAEGVEAVVSGVGAVEGGWAREEGDGDGVGFVVVSARLDALGVLDKSITHGEVLLHAHIHSSKLLRGRNIGGIVSSGRGSFQSGSRESETLGSTVDRSG